MYVKFVTYQSKKNCCSMDMYEVLCTFNHVKHN